MKKFLFALGFLALSFSSQAETSTAELLTLDEQQVAAEMVELNTLENYVSANEGVTLSELQASNAPFSTDLLNNLAISYNEPPLGIPSFIWGCGFGVLGIILVHVVAEDKAETKKALYGCLVGTAVGVLIYVLVFAAAASSVQ